MAKNHLITIYQAAYNFLLQQNGITKEVLEKHLQLESVKPDNLKTIYNRFCESAQNRQMSNKVIGRSIGGIQKLSEVLFDFEPAEVVKHYSKKDNLKLLGDIKKKLKPTGQLLENPRSLWPQFCQSVIDSAYFLQQFNSAKMFYVWADAFANDTKSKPGLPLIMSIEITGIGFPLACDILKELGYIEYGKPDIHLKDIFKALNLLDPNEKSVIKQDYETLKIIDRIALENKRTAYAVDKTFWLVGSGDFYLTGQNVGRKKHEFIDNMLKKY